MSKKSPVVPIVIAAVVIVVIVAVVLGLSGNKANSNNKATKTPSHASASAPSINNAVVITKNLAGIGAYLAEPNGYALYTYNSDRPGVSNCTGSCLSIWPAYQDKGSTTNLPAGIGTIKRADNGEIQYTYKGMPLYTFVSDKPDQVTGNGVAGFSVARP
jgi:predicted lipoprotein with Yx(FWY)xxD motif